MRRTTSSARQLRQPQRGKVRGARLERNVRVPDLRVVLLDDQLVGLGNAVERAELLGADGADLRVLAAQVALGVEDRVDVEARGGRAARQLAEAQDELLLELGGEAVLGAEEDDAALGDWDWS